MRNVDDACVQITRDRNIRFEENRRKIVFANPDQQVYKKVQVDGCVCDMHQCSAFNTQIQKKKKFFKERHKSELVVKEKQHVVSL